MSKAQPVTPRRSSRFLTLTTPSRKEVDPNLSCAWVGKPTYIRPTNGAIDFMEDDNDRRKTLENEEEELETVFYRSFEMKNELQLKSFRSPVKPRTKGKKSIHTGAETY